MKPLAGVDSGQEILIFLGCSWNIVVQIKNKNVFLFESNINYSIANESMFIILTYAALLMQHSTIIKRSIFHKMFTIFTDTQ